MDGWIVEGVGWMMEGDSANVVVVVVVDVSK